MIKIIRYLLFYLIYNHKINCINCIPSGDDDDSREELKNQPPDHVIPYSEHENPREPLTKAGYVAPGHWAKPNSIKNISLDFIPTRLYAQVRHSDTVKRVPREQALAEARTDEERANIGRLREVVKKQKVNTYYTEEGYEDAAYDHAGHIRDADFDEKYDKNVSKKDGADEESKNHDDYAGKVKRDHLKGHGDDDDDDGDEESEESELLRNFNNIYPYRGYYSIWEESGASPRGFAEEGIWELERDLIEKNREASKGAETKVPKNLRNLADSRSDEDHSRSVMNIDDDDKIDDDNDISDFEFDEKASNLKVIATEPESNVTNGQQSLKIIQETTLKPEPLIFTKKTSISSSSPILSTSTTSPLSSKVAGFKALYKSSASPTTSKLLASRILSTSAALTLPTSSRSPTSSILSTYSSRSASSSRYPTPSTSSNYSTVTTPSRSPAPSTSSAYSSVSTLSRSPTPSRYPTSATSSNYSAVPTSSKSSTSSRYPTPSTSSAYSSVSTLLRSPTSLKYPAPSTSSNYSSVPTSLRSPASLRYPTPSTSSTYSSVPTSLRSSTSSKYPTVPTSSISPTSPSSTYRTIPTSSPISPTSSTTPKPSTYKYPSLSQVYETWKRKGVEEKFEESSPDLREGEQNLILSSEEYFEEGSEEVEAARKLNKNYVLLVRSPNVPCNESKSKNQYLQNHKRNNELHSPPSSAEKITFMRPPAKSRQRITYNFLPKAYDNQQQPSMTYESGSLEENKTPQSILTYRYHKQPHYRHSSNNHKANSNQDLKNSPVYPSIKMVPPSSMSRSEYARYNTERRNGSKPQHTLRLKNLSADRFQARKTPSSSGRRNSPLNSKKHYEKAPLKGVKRSHQPLAERTSTVSRQKRSQNHLNDAPRVVEEVVDEEFNARFSEEGENEEDEDNNQESGFFSDEPEDDEDKVNKHVSGFFSEDSEDAEKYTSSDEEYKVDDEEKRVEVEVPNFNFAEINQLTNNLVKQDNLRNTNKRTSKFFNNRKYPFYNDRQISRSSALKYITNPLRIPQKTPGGSEFYDSRDKYLDCDEVEPDLSQVVPEEEQPKPDRGPNTNLPRLQGLGDKISCLKAKYFDRNPLDNPLFAERRIESAEIPEELNPDVFKHRISSLSADSDEYVHRRVSRKPEIIDIRPLESRRNEIVDQQSKHRLSQAEPPAWINHARRYRARSRATTAAPFMPYQRLVYEDVMGTIMNLAHMYRQSTTPRPSSRYRNKQILEKIRRSPYGSSSRSEEKKDIVYFTTQPPDSSSEAPLRKLKIYPYRTNKVTYRTRPVRGHRGASNKTVGYIKTVRVHKREIREKSDDEDDDLDLSETRIATRLPVNETSRRRRRGPGNVTLEADTTKKVYTVIDRIKNARPQGTQRHGDFESNSTSAATKRNEPTYNPIRKFDEIYEVGYGDKVDTKKFDSRYDVIEAQDENGPVAANPASEADATEELAEADEEIDDGGTGNGTEEKENREQVEKPDESGSRESTESKKYSNESSGSDKHHDEEKSFLTISEHEKDFDRFSSRPFSPFQSYHDPKYVGLGPRINKPAFHHPSFESVGSDSRTQEKLKNQSNEESREYFPWKSKFVFPWHEDGEDASEESRKFERLSGIHEFPWERRARLRSGNGTNEHHPSESLTQSVKARPWDFSSPFGFEMFWSAEFDSHGSSSETHPSKIKQQSSESESGSESLQAAEGQEVEVKQKQSIERDPENTTAATTATPQIPATSTELLTLRKRLTTPTTPIIPVTTSREVFTISPRMRRRGNVLKDLEKSESSIVSSTEATSGARILRRRGQVKKNDGDEVNNNRKRRMNNHNHNYSNYNIYYKRNNKYIDNNNNTHNNNDNNNNNNNNNNDNINKNNNNNNNYNDNNNDNNDNINDANNVHNYRRRFRMTSSTTARPQRKLSNTDNKSTTPATRRIEHRSKLSTEEIITKTSFPLMNQNKHNKGIINNNEENNRDNSTMKNEMKVSILTQETPEHIFQTKEIDDNGKKNMFISIIPNNSTKSSQASSESVESIEDSLARSRIDSLEDKEDRFIESTTDMNLSLLLLSNEKVKRSEDSKKMKSSERDVDRINNLKDGDDMLRNNTSGIETSGFSNESEESMDVSDRIDRIGVEDLEDRSDEPITIDVSLPASDKVKLTEHETKKIMTSVSFISENYDF